MNKIWHVIRRTLFWSYDRGTWQYDVLVVAIVVFVLLAPRSWFNDQPQTASPAGASSAAVQLLSEDASLNTKTYRLPVQLLAMPQRTPELERKAHDVLRNNVAELKGRAFRIERIEAVVGEDGSVLYYAVRVK